MNDRPKFWDSAFPRLALLFAGSFAVSVALVLGAVYASVRHHLEDRSRQAISQEINRIFRSHGIVEIQDMVKIAISAEAVSPSQSFLYFLADQRGRCAFPTRRPRNQCAVASDAEWTRLPVEGDGWIETSVRAGNGQPLSILARVREHRSGYRLMVARPIQAQQSFIAGLTRISLLAAAGGVAFGCVIAWLVSRTFLARVNRINSACAEIGHAGLDDRIPRGRRRDEFDLLAENINGMLDRLSEVVQTLANFANQVAHDFRTPLTRLRASLEDRREDRGPEGRDPDGRDPDVQRPVAEIDGLLGSFEALLQVARAEAAGLSAFEPIDLRSLVDNLAAIYEPVADDAGQRLTIDLPPVVVQGRYGLVQQMIGNLLDNAIKYTPTGGTISVTGRCHGQTVRLTVADTGPGVSAQEREAVMEHFVRGRAGLARPGIGYGLSFVRAVARSHGFGLALSDNRPGLAVTVEMTCDPRPAPARPGGRV